MKPLAVVQNSSLLTRTVSFIANGDLQSPILEGLPDAVVDGHSEGEIKFTYPDLGLSCAMSINEEGTIHYSFAKNAEYEVIVDPIEGAPKRYSLQEFFEEFPPCLIFPDGSALVDGFYSKPSSIPELSASILTPIEWPGCDIHSEIGDTDVGMSVQRFIGEVFLSSSDPQLIVINDHGAQEIADIIAIDMARNHITLIHVKSAGYTNGKPDKPGGRKSDLEDVVSQALCSCRWIKHEGFAREIQRRITERPATRVLRGNSSQVQKFVAEYSPVLFSFEIIIAQPATRSSRLSPAIRSIVASAQDYIEASGARLTLLCSVPG